MKEFLGEILKKNEKKKTKTAEFCLAFQVTASLSDKQYKKGHHSLSELQPITAVKQVEGSNWPGSASFTLESPKPCFPDENHLPLNERIAPIHLMTSFPNDPITQRPNVSRYRFHYDKAIAQTLAELKQIITHDFTLSH